jgi:hypothetical protein
MQLFVILLLILFVIGQILIIHYIRNKFSNKNKTGKKERNNILEAELDLEVLKTRGMFEFRRFTSQINGI